MTSSLFRPALLASVAVVAAVVLVGCSPTDAITKAGTGAGNDAGVAADLATFRPALASYAAANGQLTADVATLKSWGAAQSVGTSNLVIHLGSGSAYCIDADSTSGKAFHMTQDGVVSDGSC